MALLSLALPVIGPLTLPVSTPVPSHFLFPFCLAPRSWVCGPCSSSHFPPSPLESQTSILICKAGLEAWAGPLSRALFTRPLRGDWGLLPSPSAASGGWMECLPVTGISLQPNLFTSLMWPTVGPLRGWWGIGRSQLEFIPCPEEDS